MKAEPDSSPPLPEPDPNLDDPTPKPDPGYPNPGRYKEKSAPRAPWWKAKSGGRLAEATTNRWERSNLPRLTNDDRVAGERGRVRWRGV